MPMGMVIEALITSDDSFLKVLLLSPKSLFSKSAAAGLWELGLLSYL